MKNAIFILLILVFGYHSRAYCQYEYAEQSVTNTKIAWESIFPDKKCILLLKKSNQKFETIVYEVKHFKCEVVKTNSRVNPYKLTVRVDIEKWSSREKKISIEDALANVEQKGDRFQGSGISDFPLTALYKLENGRWEFTMGNKWMIDFLMMARARYNMHVDISKIVSIPQNH